MHYFALLSFVRNVSLARLEETELTLFTISGFVLDKKLQRNASKFAIFFGIENK